MLISKVSFMIKIISGHSGPGGSTTAFINLTNLFNKNGCECVFYGPHDYHLNKCNGKIIGNLTISKYDIIISHYINLPKIQVKKHIFSCHETDAFRLSTHNLDRYDKIHYVSQWQKDWQNVDKEYFILPNVLDDLKKNDKPSGKIGGVIGTIFPHKQTHLSIQRALDDGCDKVYLYGNIGDQNYFDVQISKFISDKVEYLGQCENKQKMYDSVTDVYQDSKSETWGYVKGECIITNTNYHGNSATDNFWMIDNNEILKRWIKELR